VSLKAAWIRLRLGRSRLVPLIGVCCASACIKSHRSGFYSIDRRQEGRPRYVRVCLDESAFSLSSMGFQNNFITILSFTSNKRVLVQGNKVYLDEVFFLNSQQI